jgi:hypothetical protein
MLMVTGSDDSGGRSGLFVTGELLGVKREPGRPRPNGDGNYPDRYKVGVRVGPDVFDVEYRDQHTADAMLSAMNPGMTSKGDTVTLGVRPRAAKGYVFWMGEGEAAGGGDYE